MTWNRSMPLWLVLLGVTATWGSYPLPYTGLDVSPVPIAPHFIYSSPFADGDFKGYSYFTSDLGGGNSEVLFFTGVDSKNALDNEATLMHGTKKTAVSKTATEKGVESTTETTVEDSGSSNGALDSSSTVDKDIETVTSTTSAFDSPAPTDASTKSSAIPKSGKDPKQKPHYSFDQPSSFGIGDLSNFGISSFGAPYPIIRFGGAPSFYPSVSTSYSGFSDLSDPFGSNYHPYYDSFNSFQNYNPYFSSQGNYWNNDDLPSFYQNPFYSHSFGTVLKTLKPKTTDSPKTSTPAGKSGSETPETPNKLPTATFRSAFPTTIDALPDKSTETVAPTISSEFPSLASDSKTEPTTVATEETTTVA